MKFQAVPVFSMPRGLYRSVKTLFRICFGGFIPRDVKELPAFMVRQTLVFWGLLAVFLLFFCGLLLQDSIMMAICPGGRGIQCTQN